MGHTQPLFSLHLTHNANTGGKAQSSVAAVLCKMFVFVKESGVILGREKSYQEQLGPPRYISSCPMQLGLSGIGVSNQTWSLFTFGFFICSKGQVKWLLTLQWERVKRPAFTVDKVKTYGRLQKFSWCKAIPLELTKQELMKKNHVQWINWNGRRKGFLPGLKKILLGFTEQGCEYWTNKHKTVHPFLRIFHFNLFSDGIYWWKHQLNSWKKNRKKIAWPSSAGAELKPPGLLSPVPA